MSEGKPREATAVFDAATLGTSSVTALHTKGQGRNRAISGAGPRPTAQDLASAAAGQRRTHCGGSVQAGGWVRSQLPAVWAGPREQSPGTLVNSSPGRTSTIYGCRSPNSATHTHMQYFIFCYG